MGYSEHQLYNQVKRIITDHPECAVYANQLVLRVWDEDISDFEMQRITAQAFLTKVRDGQLKSIDLILAYRDKVLKALKAKENGEEYGEPQATEDDAMGIT
jgi:hypothetical protein